MHLHKILQTDKTIYEEFLGMNWEHPVNQLFKKEDFIPSKKVDASSLDKFLLKCPQLSLEPEKKRRRIYECVKKALTRHADFLNDPKINSIVQPYGAHAETLVKLNNVIDNLGITSLADVNILVDFMKPYIHCTQCKEQLSSTDQSIHGKVEHERRVDHEVTEIALIHSKRLDIITPFVQNYEFTDFDKVVTDTSVILPDILSPPSRSLSSHTTVSRKSRPHIGRAKSLTDIIEQSNLSLVVDTKVGDTFEVEETLELDASSDYFQTELSCSIQWTEDVATKNDDVISETKTLIEVYEQPVEETEDQLNSTKMKQTPVKDSLIPFICADDTHELSIERSDVLKAIQQFIRGYKFLSQEGTGFKNNSTYLKEKQIDKADVERYWNQFLIVFPEEKVELWNSVFKSLEKFHQALSKRQKLNEELSCLSSRNQHLRTLLQSYIKPDAELKSESLPPIHMTDNAKKLSTGKPFLHC